VGIVNDADLHSLPAIRVAHAGLGPVQRGEALVVFYALVGADLVGIPRLGARAGVAAASQRTRSRGRPREAPLCIDQATLQRRSTAGLRASRLSECGAGRRTARTLIARAVAACAAGGHEGRAPERIRNALAVGIVYALGAADFTNGCAAGAVLAIGALPQFAARPRIPGSASGLRVYLTPIEARGTGRIIATSLGTDITGVFAGAAGGPVTIPRRAALGGAPDKAARWPRKAMAHLSGFAPARPRTAFAHTLRALPPIAGAARAFDEGAKLHAAILIGETGARASTGALGRRRRTCVATGPTLWPLAEAVLAALTAVPAAATVDIRRAFKGHTTFALRFAGVAKMCAAPTSEIGSAKPRATGASLCPFETAKGVSAAGANVTTCPVATVLPGFTAMIAGSAGGGAVAESTFAGTSRAPKGAPILILDAGP
jgi:hypothetical protein